MILRRNFYILFICDLALFSVALFGAYLLRFDFYMPPSNLSQYWRLLPPILLMKSAAFIVFGLYKGMWRYTSVSDLSKLLQATVISTLGLTAIVLFVFRFQGFSRAVFLLDWGLTLIFTGGIRLLIRVTYARGLWGKGYNGIKSQNTDVLQTSEGKLAIIVGAGSAGEKLIRELKESRRLNYRIKALVDDDKDKIGRTIHGVPVLGSVEELPAIVKKCKASEIFIAMPSARGPSMRRIVKHCESCGIPYKTLPGMGELVEGRVSIKELRDVSYEDLLGRPPVRLDMEGIRNYLQGRKILVTGAGGSIGSELCRQIVRFEPQEIVLLDAGEANLFAIQMEMKHRLDFSGYAAILADVTNRMDMQKVLKRYTPDVVVHAAAYKHVPMLERNPWEAVRNNVIGSLTLISEVAAAGVSRFVMVSTDKAVRPTNVMGASKRVCELIMQAYQGENSCRMMCVRFGNVVGSSGSVIPLFKRQIAGGGPVTVTDPEMTRYFMTIPEASQLILQAGAIGEGGEVFILEMGEPVKIIDMARDLIRLSGKEPDKEIEITISGLRPGEKLCEELITVGEGIVPTAHEKIMMLKNDGGWFGSGSREAFRDRLLKEIAELEAAALSYDAAVISAKLKELVPEYSPSNSECVL